MAVDDHRSATTDGVSIPESAGPSAGQRKSPDFVSDAVTSRMSGAKTPTPPTTTTLSGSPWRLVRLDPTDELPDILRRVELERTPRVCLVLEESVPSLHSLVVLRALRSRTAAGQVTLGISARDEGLLGMAAVAGLEKPLVDASSLDETTDVARLSSENVGSPRRSLAETISPDRRGGRDSSSLGRFWQATTNLWTTEPPKPEAIRPRTAAEALAAVAAGSSARLTGAERRLTSSVRQSRETSSPSLPNYRYAATGDTLAPTRRLVHGLGLPNGWQWPAIVILMAVLFLGAYLLIFLPNARVTLHTAPVPFTAEVAVTADARMREIDVSGSKLPARVLSAEAADELELPTTGQEVVPDRKAVGEILLTNRRSRNLIVKSGTIVRAGDVDFVTTNEVVIPSSVLNGPQQSFGMARAKIEAAIGGTAGNMAPEAINEVLGPLSTSLEVRNDQATQGGTNRMLRFVTSEDRRALYNTLYAALREQVELSMNERERTGQSLVVWPDPNPATIDEVYDPAEVSAEATVLRLRMKVRYSATQFLGDDVNELLREKLIAKVETIAPGWVPVDETLTIDPPAVQRVEQGDGAVHMLIRVRGYREPNVDVGKIRSALAGRTRADAQAYLDSQPGFASRELAVWPKWSQTLPRINFRIAVEKNRPAAVGS